jgi:hypothetical protein
VKGRIITALLSLILAVNLIAYPAATVSADDTIRTPTISPGTGEFFIAAPDYDPNYLPVTADPKLAFYLFAVKVVGPASGGSGNQSETWSCSGRVTAYGYLHNRLWT